MAPLVLAACAAFHTVGAAATDPASLPPPASGVIDFRRDIQPILEQSCLQCHGPEKPKSGYRLDHREDALKEANYDRPILPGDSTNSPLIHYVAHLVEDMEMPPPGKADRLTDEQVGLLRAWIDQGVAWEEAELTPLEMMAVPMMGWFFVDGDEGRFREHHWVQEGWQAGLEDFTMRQVLDRDTEVLATARALRDDYRVGLEWRRRDVGFVRGGFEQYRRYYDDSGGYYRPFVPPEFELGEDLSMDLGRAYVEGGLTRPGLPEVVLGYEYLYREGEKSTLQWLPVAQGGGVRDIRPGSKRVDETVHIARAVLRYEVAGVGLEDNFRMEYYDLETKRVGVLPWPADSNGSRVPIEEGTDYHQLANSATAEKHWRDWLLVSAGYLYTDLDGNASFRQSTVDAAGQPAPGLYWSGNDITIEQQSHTANANAQLGPWGGWVFHAGVQPEWSRQKGFGDVRLDEGLPPFPGGVAPVVIQADLDRFRVEEQAGFRMTSIPRTTVFGEARLRQESISQYEETAGSPSGTNPDFLRDTDASNDLQDYRGGFHVSPWHRMSLSAHYRKRLKKNDYDHDADVNSVGAAYSAFITGQQFDTDEVETKLVLRPARWLKTTLSFRVEETDYETKTDAAPPFTPGGRLGEAGEHDAQVYGVNFVLTPIRRLYFSTTFTYADTRTRAFANGDAAIVPYEGDIYSVLASSSYAVNEKSDLTVTYNYSRADYQQDNEAAGLPVGLRYDQHTALAGLKRRLTGNVTSQLQYGFYYYDEPSSGGENDYIAHGIFGSVAIRFP